MQYAPKKDEAMNLTKFSLALRIMPGAKLEFYNIYRVNERVEVKWHLCTLIQGKEKKVQAKQLGINMR